jgi:hypothetical protein
MAVRCVSGVGHSADARFAHLCDGLHREGLRNYRRATRQPIDAQILATITSWITEHAR